jgi:glycine cleavage system H lipoate-binding protein
MTDFPADLRYGKDHLWTRPDDGASKVRVGLPGQQSLGDVVEVTLPRIGETVSAGEAAGQARACPAAATQGMTAVKGRSLVGDPVTLYVSTVSPNPP